MHKHGHAPAHRREVLAEQCWQGHSAAPQGCRMSADIPRDAGSTGQGAQHRLSLTSNRERAQSGPSLAGDSISVTQLRDAHVQATSKPHPQGKPCRQGQLPRCNAEGAVGARIRMLGWPHHPNGPTAPGPSAPARHTAAPVLAGWRCARAGGCKAGEGLGTRLTKWVLLASCRVAWSSPRLPASPPHAWCCPKTHPQAHVPHLPAQPPRPPLVLAGQQTPPLLPPHTLCVLPSPFPINHSHGRVSKP